MHLCLPQFTYLAGGANCNGGDRTSVETYDMSSPSSAPTLLQHGLLDTRRGMAGAVIQLSDGRRGILWAGGEKNGDYKRYKGNALLHEHQSFN